MTVIEIRVELKKGVADPEGKNTKKTVEALGFTGINSVKFVKVFEMDIDAPADKAKEKHFHTWNQGAKNNAASQVLTMADKLRADAAAKE